MKILISCLIVCVISTGLGAGNPCSNLVKQKTIRGKIISVDGAVDIPMGPAWEASLYNIGPWNLDECCLGYSNFETRDTNVYALYFSFFSDTKLEDVYAAASAHRLPCWLNLPPWEPGIRSDFRVMNQPGIRVQRINGFRHEELQLIQINQGVLVLHFLDFLSGPYTDFLRRSEEIVTAALNLPIDALRHVNSHNLWRKQFIVPQTLSECFNVLNKWFTRKQVEQFKNDKENELFFYGEGIGPRERPNVIWWIEHYFGLRDGGSPLSKELKLYGFDEHDYAEAVLHAYHRALLGENVDLKLILKYLKNENNSFQQKSILTPIK